MATRWLWLSSTLYTVARMFMPLTTLYVSTRPGGGVGVGGAVSVRRCGKVCQLAALPDCRPSTARLKKIKMCRSMGIIFVNKHYLFSIRADLKSERQDLVTI